MSWNKIFSDTDTKLDVDYNSIYTTGYKLFCRWKPVNLNPFPKTYFTSHSVSITTATKIELDYSLIYTREMA